ncbi:MAG: FAD-binding oxidoreductase [Hyphomicrobiaceae bacterium]
MTTLAAALAGILPAGGVITDPVGMEPYCLDWRGRFSARPACVIRPASTEEVAAAVQLCVSHGAAIYPQGGNTGLCYGAVPGAGEKSVVLSLGRMTRIRSIEKASNSLICDAGCVLASIHDAAASVGRRFPLHLGSEGSAQIGGLVSTNAGGTGVVRYGPMRDLVYGLEVVLADGRVWNGLTTLRKDNTAYDIKHLFIGAEGSLGIVTAASLKLFPALKSRADAWVAVESPRNALELLTRCQDEFDTAIQAFELLSRSEVEIGLANVAGNRIPFETAPPWSVLIELGETHGEAGLVARLELILAEAAEAGEVADAAIAQNETQAKSFWRLRHTLSEANKRHGLSHTHDISVPVSAVPRFIAEADRMLADRYPSAMPVVVSHMGDGNVHYIAMFSFADWQGVADKQAAIDDLQTRVHDIAVSLGGSFSAEHGIGRKLVGELERLTSPLELELIRRVKTAFDPDERLNPGVVLRQGRAGGART